MNGYTQCTVLGRITKDIEVKFVGAEGTPLAEFGVAINRKYRNREEVQFFDIQMWGDRVESFIQYHGKGSPCLVVGELSQQRWTDKDTEPGSRQTSFVDGRRQAADVLDEETPF